MTPTPPQEQTELLPCPFCGHATAPQLATSADLDENWDDSNVPYYAVFCDASKPGGRGGCGASGGFAPTEAEAIERWNRRASMQAQAPEVAALQREVEELRRERDELAQQRGDLAAKVLELEQDRLRLDHIAKFARCDPKMDGLHVWWPTTFKNQLTGPTLRAAIDKARGVNVDTNDSHHGGSR